MGALIYAGLLRGATNDIHLTFRARACVQLCPRLSLVAVDSMVVAVRILVSPTCVTTCSSWAGAYGLARTPVRGRCMHARALMILPLPYTTYAVWIPLARNVRCTHAPCQQRWLTPDAVQIEQNSVKSGHCQIGFGSLVRVDAFALGPVRCHWPFAL